MSRKAVLLRIDAALWAALRKWADDELRSVNGQIEYILRDAVRKRKGISQACIVEPGTDEKGSGDERPAAADSGL